MEKNPGCSRGCGMPQCLAFPMPCLVMPKRAWSEEVDLAMTEGVLPGGIPFAAELSCPEPCDQIRLDLILPAAAFTKLLGRGAFERITSPAKGPCPSWNNSWTSLLFFGIRDLQDVMDPDCMLQVFSFLIEKGLLQVPERTDDLWPEFQVSIGKDPNGMDVILFSAALTEELGTTNEYSLAQTDLTFSNFADLFGWEKP